MLHNYFKQFTEHEIKVKIACPCIDQNDIPVTDFSKLTHSFIAATQTDPLLTFGMSIDQAYELIFEKCIERGMTHVFIVESDVIVPKAALDRLLMRSAIEGHPFVGGVYPFKDGTDICPAVTGQNLSSQIIMPVRVPAPYTKRGLIPIARALPMGCSIIDLRILSLLPKPWAKTSTVMIEESEELITQDCWLTVNFLQAGYTPMLDTNIQCLHVDRVTKKQYGSPEIIKEEMAC